MDSRVNRHQQRSVVNICKKQKGKLTYVALIQVSNFLKIGI